MTPEQAVDRSTVVEMLAGFGGRRPQDVAEQIDSLELAWLVHEVSRRYGVRLGDDDVERMMTVSDAAEVIGKAVQDVRAG